LITGFFAVLASKVPFSYSASKLLGDDHPARQDIIAANNHLGWGTSIDVLIDTKKANGIQEPQNLALIQQIQDSVMALKVNDIKAANSVSIVDLIKEVNRAINNNHDKEYRIPESAELIAQEFLLFEMSGGQDIAKLVDKDKQLARINFLLPEEDMSRFYDYVKELRSTVNRITQNRIPFEITGVINIEMDTFNELMSSLSVSYFVSLLIITPLMMVVAGRVGFGIVIMLPNVVPLVISLGIMYLLDIPLNLFTIMIGSIALGIAVDDTIHFTHSYRAYRQANMTNLEAIQSTMLTSGSAMLVTAVVLSLGFLIYCLATMEAVCQFGLVASMCIFLAFIADVTLTPALVTLYSRIAESEKNALFQDKINLCEQHS
jgi:predicted RND superfamily exporter protein